MNPFHPELRGAARMIPRFSFTPGLARFARFVQRLGGVKQPKPAPDTTIRDVMIAGPPDNPSLRVRLYSPAGMKAWRPAMLWIHGGGFILGTPEQDEANIVGMCRDLDLVVAAVSYRLAPDHPYPAALNDCHAALTWLYDSADELGIAKDRIAIGGNSAGAGLAAGLVLYAHDDRRVPVAFQLLIYPMLDDRTTKRTDIDQARLRLWTSKSNLLGWTSYLGQEPGGEDVPDYAAPARRKRLDGLPPAWIGVGTCDLFHDEDVTYAARLREAGVPCTLKVVEGAFHGFDLAGKAKVVAEFRESYVEGMRSVLQAS